MSRRTLGWTEGHTGVVLLAVVLVAASTAGLAERPPVMWWVMGAVLASCLIGLALDVYGGVVGGLVCAAAFAGVRQYFDRWAERDFAAALVEVLAIVAAGAAAGATAQRLRRLSTRKARPETAFGSLGLLPLEAATNRLDEELERARAHRRPLTLAMFSVRVTGTGRDPGAQGAALRAVARMVEHRAAETDVPFAVAEDQLGLILPETDQAQAWERVGEVLDAFAGATFTSGPDRRRYAVSEATDYSVGIIEANPEHSSAQALLEAALLSRQATPKLEGYVSRRAPAAELER